MGEISPADGSGQLAAWMQMIERRLAAIETTRRMPNTTQQGGSFVLASEDGDPLFEMGEYAGNQQFGLRMLDSQGASVFETSEAHAGLRYPFGHIAWHPANAGTLSADGGVKTLTSSSFISLWSQLVQIPAHDALLLYLFVSAPSGTDGEIRLESSLGNTDAFALTGDGTIKTISFQWIHPITVGWGGEGAGTGTLVSVQARRTAGSGDITVYWPTTATWINQGWLSDPSTDGNPTEV